MYKPARMWYGSTTNDERDDMPKPPYRAEVEGSKDSISAESWDGLLEGAVQLMIYKGRDVVTLFEIGEDEQTYDNIGALRLDVPE